MARIRRWAARAAAVLAILGWTSSALVAQSGTAVSGQPIMAPDARVRGVSQRMVAVINEAAAGSPTFRGLVNKIGLTDGVVYVAEGECGHDVRACLLLTMTVMGPNRVLRILVDPQRVDREVMGSLGHELQHAVEVLSYRSIRSGSAMTLFYNRNGSKSSRRFETDAAIKAGIAVRAELEAPR